MPDPSARAADSADPIIETLARIARLGPDYDLTVAPDGDSWLAADEIISGGPAFDRVIERLAAGPNDPAARRAIGSRFVLLYLRFLWPIVAAFSLERRVPDAAAENLLVRLDGDGWPEAFALREPRFAVLESDPASEVADVVASEEPELLAWLQTRTIESNAAPLIETVRKRLFTSGTALWGNVAAAFADPLLWHIQQIAPESSSVVRDAEALLAAPAGRLGDQIRLIRLEDADGSWTVHARRTCCLRWCLPGEERCDDCPLMREPQADAFLRARLAEAIARGERLRRELALATSIDRRSRDAGAA